MQIHSPTPVKAIELDSKPVEAKLQATARVGIEPQSWVNKPTFGADEDGEVTRAQRRGGGETVYLSLEGLEAAYQYPVERPCSICFLF